MAEVPLHEPVVAPVAVRLPSRRAAATRGREALRNLIQDGQL